MAKIKFYKSGFTLVELLVVIAILGCLLLIAVPSFSGLQGQWKTYVCLENRDRLLMVIQSELAKKEMHSSAFPEADEEAFYGYHISYGVECPNGGRWSLSQDGNRLCIFCTECE